MARVSFPKGKQSKWINKLLEERKINIDRLAKICGVSARTIRDWRREKFKISKKALLQLNKQFEIPIPAEVKYLSDFWYVRKGARKGALRRMELYGPPGTVEGRKKGGRISQLKRKLHPELYQNCILRKKFLLPQYSNNLAELVGIILGDGGITDYQLKISLNKETEPEYIELVTHLIKKIFGELPKKYYFHARKEKVCDICIGGAELIKFLKKIGLEKGSKVLRQAGVPEWIIKNKKYSLLCLRGLIDTDGAVYYHHHTTKGSPCFNVGLTFTNHSKPLLEFVYNTLLNTGFTAKLKEHSVYLYRFKEVKDYFKKIGSHNLHHVERMKEFFKLKNIRRSTQVVDEARLESV